MPRNGQKKRKLPAVSVAPLYKEDIRLEGLKKKRISSTSTISFTLQIDEQEERKRRQRMQRFVEHNEKKKQPAQKNSFPGDSTFGKVLKSKSNVSFETNESFVGKSTALEKAYMRLTSAPKAEDVRPLPVLRKALSHVKAHFVENEDFDFANEQLKSIRQDITVQHLRNNFVLEVYETHSRMLLEHGDLDEFNQCQTMIRSLTGITKSSGKTKKPKKNSRKCDILMQSEEAADEFWAYSLLYDVVQNSWCDLTTHLASRERNSDCTKKFDESSKGTKRTTEVPITQGASVRHAMKVVNAIIHDDYLAFFRLYESAPHMSAYLMDYLVRRVRNVGYARIVAAYRPTISMEHFREVLSFHDLEETRQFLKKKGVIFINDKDKPPFWVDCKATYASIKLKIQMSS